MKLLLDKTMIIDSSRIYRSSAITSSACYSLLLLALVIENTERAFSVSNNDSTQMTIVGGL